jgi:hypothetical protein
LKPEQLLHQNDLASQSPETDVDANISEEKIAAPEPPHRECDIPLFLRDGSEGEKWDAQDEKDKSAE